MRIEKGLLLRTLSVVLLLVVPALAGDEPAKQLLSDAKRLFDCEKYDECWKKLAKVRSNYPAFEPQVAPLLNRLDAAVDDLRKAGRVSILTWPDGKAAAVSYSFDDGCKSAYLKGATSLEDYGWRGTFYLHCDGIGMNTVHWQNVHGRSHEIGCHSRTHPLDLPSLTEDEIRDEVLGGGEFLETSIVSDPVWTFSYPHSNEGPKDGPLRRIIRSKYLAARTGLAVPPYNSPTPPEADAICSLRVLTDTDLSILTDAVDDTITYNGWLIYMFHAVILNDGWQPVEEEVWNGCLDHLESVSDQIWMAPVLTIARYIECRRTAETNWCVVDDQSIQVFVNCPGAADHLTALTVSVRVPATWTQVALSDRPGLLTVRKSHVTFSLRPDGRPITITKH